LLVGLEVLALMRGLFTATDPFALGIDVPEVSVTEGYARWATTYAPGNPWCPPGRRWCGGCSMLPLQAARWTRQAAEAFIPKATEAAYLGLPAVLIWDPRVAS
jgi:hypothetical protein